MSKKLFIEAILKYVLGVILVGLLIFLPAGTINYLKGWIFMGILFVPMFIAGVVMMIKNPKLLKSRLDSKEEQGEQKQGTNSSQGMRIGENGFPHSSEFAIEPQSMSPEYTPEESEIELLRLPKNRKYTFFNYIYTIINNNIN